MGVGGEGGKRGYVNLLKILINNENIMVYISSFRKYLG